MSASVYASVVFLKVQEFARRPASEQARMRAQLQAALAVAACELAPEARVLLEAADGAAVVVLRDPAGALRVAERAMAAAAAGLPLSAGVNHGAVQPVEANDGAAAFMAGDGLAVAASVAEFASPSRLLASRAFRDALADAAPGQEAVLARAGTFADANLRVHEVFVPDRRAARRRGHLYLGACVLAAVALAGGGIAWRIARDGQEAFVSAAAAKAQAYRAQARAYWADLLKRKR